MAKIRVQHVISDAGPIIHLDELACLDLLFDFASVHVPEAVWNEVFDFRPNLADSLPHNFKIAKTSEPASPRLATLVHAMDLHGGEIAALTLAEQKPCDLLLCDDSAARLVAESLGIKVRGTVGLVARAIRQGKRSPSETLSILQSIPTRSSLHIAASLLDEVIGLVSKQ